MPSHNALPSISDHDAEPATDRRQTDPATWLNRYGSDLLRHAYARLGDRQLAEDAVQETLAAAFCARHRYAGASSERTWLVAILNHKIFDTVREKQRHAAALRTATDPVEHWFSPRNRQANCSEDPESSAERLDFRRVFAECTARLPPKLYKAFMLYEVHDVSGANASQILGVSTTNVWVMLHRARRLLANCLTARWFGRPCGTSRRA